MLDDISENVTRKDGHEYIATRALFQLLEIKPTAPQPSTLSS